MLLIIHTMYERELDFKSVGRSVFSVHLTNGHEVEIFMYAKTRHFSGFVAGNCRENPCAERISAVSLVKVPDFHL